MFADILSWAIFMALPGPDIVAIGTQVSRNGRAAGLKTALGAALGVATWSVLSLVGITALLAAVPALAAALPILGSIVLVVLGLLALRSALRRHPEPSAAAEVVEGENPAKRRSRLQFSGLNKRPLRLGLITNLSNPKALVFFTSIFTPMMQHYDGLPAKAWLLALLLTITVAVFSTMSLIIGAVSASPLSRLPAMRFIPGAAFLLIGGYYLIESLPA